MLRRAAFLAQMLRNESLSPATLAARQTRQLRALVRHAAARVPFYRELYAARGIRADSFDGLHDLHSLPIVDKQVLRAAGDAAISLDAPAERITISTSGSTGEPFQFQIDRRYDQWRKAQYLRPYLRAGQRLRDKVLRLTGRPTQRVPWFSKLGFLREWRMDCAVDPARIVEAWQRLSPDVLQGYPSALRSLAHYCLDSGRPLAPAPRLVFTDSELLLPDTRALLGRAFETPVTDIFGTFETDNIAYQCALRNGYHIAIDCVVVEIIRDGEPAPLGAEGEIVVTVLANRTQPFIRYNLKDIGRLATQACTCGSPFPLLTMIAGRANDLIVLADGRRCTPQGIFARMNRFADAIRHYQLRQTGIGRFEMLVVPSIRFPNVGREGILDAIGSTLGDAKIEVRLVDMIPTERSGKRRIFVSELPTDGRTIDPSRTQSASC